ncbi:MAG: bacterial Ig-like domain-containing protein [Clostridia bacterium]|nr:bacterial Ig-like domain-containing protein [Clostridia bacterium]
MRKILAMLLATLAIACLAGSAVSMATNQVAHAEDEVVEEVKPTHNDTSIINTEAPKTEAYAIAYDGTPTIRYGMQAYAGLDGAAWMFGAYAGTWMDCGTGSHPFGSNSGDKRSNLAMTFKIDSTVEGTAYLYLYVECYDSATGGAKLVVNGGEAVDVNIKDNKILKSGAPADVTVLPVTLVKGMNTLVLTMGENYTSWFYSFCVSPEMNAIHAIEGKKMTYPMGIIAQHFGDAAIGHDVLGLNAFDNAADYGKQGGAVYNIIAPKAGEYTLGFAVMAGNGLANRAKYTLNDQVLTFDGKPYYSFSTAAGWSGDSWNNFNVTLKEGLNTLKIENQLTYVNAAKTEELDASAADGVYVSNWWMHQITIEEKQEIYLEIDTSNVKTTYNPDREFSAEGLVVYYVQGTQKTALTADQYTVSTPNVRDFGSKEVVVEMVDSDLKASYTIVVGLEGTEYEGKVVEFDGVNGTGKLSYYMNAGIKGEGTDECAGRIFYIIENTIQTDGYFRIGSNGAGASENRQVTMTIKINNTGAEGKYLFKSYAMANNYDYDNATLTVNGEAREVNLHSTGGNPYIFELDLKQGENEIVIKTQNQYSIWWDEFEVCAIDAQLKATYEAKDGIRYGIDSMAKGVWMGKETDRMLSYYLDVAEAGKYQFTFNTAELTEEKKFTLAIGDQQQQVTVDAEGKTAVLVNLEAGLQKMSIICSGAESAFDFNGFNLAKFVTPDAIELDLANMNLELECGEALNEAKLAVNAKYGEEVKALNFNEYQIVYPEGYDVNVPGTYTITVKVIGAEEVTATFDVVVKAEKEVVSLEVNSADVKTQLNVGETLNTAELVVKAVYNDGSKQTLSSNEYTIIMPEGYDAEQAGNYVVTVEFNANKQLTATFEIEHVAAQGGQTSSPAGTTSNCKSSLGGSVAMTIGLGAIAVLLKKRKED